MKRVKSLRGAPPKIAEWWANTGVEPALFRLVELGATWEKAHERLKASYQNWWDRGRHGKHPLQRLATRVVLSRCMEDAESGKYTVTFRLEKGKPLVHIAYGNGYYAGPFTPSARRFPKLVEKCYAQ